MWKKYLLSVSLVIFLFTAIVVPKNSYAVCKGKFFNPITDIDWWGIFPIKIGGVTVFKSKIDTPPTPTGSPICICGKPPTLKIGIKVSFWDPGRLIETVKDPWCFPTLGLGLSSTGGFLGGTSDDTEESNLTFAQAHWIWIDVFQLVGMFVDFSCFDPITFDIAYITEIDPTWNSDITGFLLNPEALLFANPVAQIACSADAVASSLGIPLSPLFWCMGSWGSAYPLTGHYNGKDIVKANAGIAARMIYKLSRELLLWDPAVSYCYKIPVPIWIKSHYRLQEARPLRSPWVVPIGRSGLMWAEGHNPPVYGGWGASDNFLWVLFKEMKCCIGIGIGI